MALLSASFVVLELKEWDIEWPKDACLSYELIRDVVDLAILEKGSQWFAESYKREIWNGDLVKIEEVLKKAKRFAKKAHPPKK